MKSRVSALAIVLIAVSLIISGCGNASTDPNSGNGKDYVWGSASLGSRGYVVIEALVSTANKTTSMKNSSVSTAGGMENLALLSQGEVQFGQAQSSDMYFAANALDPFKEKIDFAQILAYGDSALPIVVLENSPIKTVQDLKGKRLLVGPAGGAAVPIMRAVLEEYGIVDEVEFVYLSWTEGPEAFKMGQVDASAAWHSDGVVPHKGFQQVAITNKFRVLEMDRDILEQVAAKNDGISVGTVKKEAFEFYEEDMVAPGVTVGLVCDPSLSEDLIYDLTKALLDNAADVQAIAPEELGQFGIDFALKGLVKAYPIHSGAAKYYREKGIWTDDYIVHE